MRYSITFQNGYGRTLDRMVVEAASFPVALGLSADLLRTGAVEGGEQAVSATVEAVGMYDCEVDESAGMAELHSVRTELHRVTGVDLDAVSRLEEFAHGLGELDCDEPSTTKED